ncbi:response regulator [Algiphilus sp.]|uniref:response regulator n=1 Tax=Algiphilus sp. TaxID=1872431 RepID=UPI003B522639
MNDGPRAESPPLRRRGLRLQTRFSLAFGIILALLTALTALYWMAADELTEVRDITRDTARRLVLIERMRSLLLENESNLRGFLLSRDEAFYTAYRELPARLAEVAASLRAIGQPDAEREALLRDIERRVSRWRNAFAEPAIDQARAGDDATVQALLAERNERALLEGAEGVLQRMAASAREQLERRETRTRQRLRTIEITVVAGIVGALFVMLLVVRLTHARVTHPMSTLAASTRRLAAGDESVTIAYQGQADEVGDIARALNQFRDANRMSRESAWIKAHVAELTERLGQQDSWEEFGQMLLTHLCAPLGALSAVLYRIDADDGAAWAVAHWADGSLQGDGRRRFARGEGLVGECLRTARTVRLEPLPDDARVQVTGTMSIRPHFLAIEPLHLGQDVVGVLEFSALEAPNAAQEALLAEVRRVLALAMDSLDGELRTRKLLEQTREQALTLRENEEELRRQQNELRATNEALSKQAAELEAQGERVQASEQEMRAQAQELRAANRELQERSDALEQASEALQRKSEEVERASRYKSEFLANMSHELRTPLNALLILARTLADNDEGNLTPDQVESAQVVYESGHNLLRLINDILDLSKIEAGRLDAERQRIPLHAFFERIHRQFAPLANEKALHYEHEIGSDLPEVIYQDGDKLRQIVVNLLGNAIKFTERGAVRLQLDCTDDELVVRVRDTGIGMDAETASRVFRAFEQADGSTSRRFGGTGLGLAISSRLAELLGGSLQVDSTPGEGSCFTLRLPLLEAPDDAASSDEAPAALPASTQPASAAPAPTLLIVEDDRNFARILAEMARDRGYSVLTAARGSDALEQARQHRPQGIVLDVGLPDMDGYAVAERLRQDAATAAIPLHFISAEDDPGAAVRGNAIGFLRKPVSREELDQVLSRLLGVATPRQILLVDDDAATRRAVAQLFAGQAGVSLSHAESGGEAISALREEGPYDCVILDLGLPDMSGFDVLDAIERAAHSPPVIVYSGRELSDDETRRLRGHADSIVIKGVQASERLLEEVQSFLRNVPGTPPAVMASAGTGGGSALALQGRRVLLVDDDVRNVFALSKALRARGLDIVMRQDAERALDYLQSEEGAEVELVLMDIMMPGMDGYTAMRRIRDMPTRAHLPIIALTAKAMEEDRDKCLEAGASDYLSKPVDVDRLVAMMRAWLAPDGQH